VEKYLLEKTRVQHQIEGERNFHIFYQLLYGADPELKGKLCLSIDDSPADFRYLVGTESVLSGSSTTDGNDFDVTKDCLRAAGVNKAQIEELFQLVAGVLHLGNIVFEVDEATGDVVDVVSGAAKDALERAASTLGLDAEHILSALTKRSMHVGGQVITKSQTRAQAVDKRDAFAKSVYSMLFDWLVEQINETLANYSPSSPAGTKAKKDCIGFIGVLDIYGFENFENANGFEQLLINYANEKLQVMDITLFMTSSGL
jgi:myosin heavy subunit